LVFSFVLDIAAVLDVTTKRAIKVT